MEHLLEEIENICKQKDDTKRLLHLSSPFKDMVKETLNPLTDGELRKFVNVCSKGLTMLLSNLESGR